MTFNKKKIILITIALGLFMVLVVGLVIFSIGMHHGYNSAIIGNKIERDCNCSAQVIQLVPNPESFIDDLKSSELVKNFTMQLTDCKYDTLDKLKQDIVTITNEKNLCQDKSIEFVVLGFKGKKEIFTVKNCNL